MLHSICTLKCILRAHFVENAETCYPKSIPAAKSRIFGNLTRTTGHQSSKLIAWIWITEYEG